MRRMAALLILGLFTVTLVLGSLAGCGRSAPEPGAVDEGTGLPENIGDRYDVKDERRGQGY